MKLKELFTNVWSYIVAVFTLLIGVFLLERHKRQNAETRARVAEGKLDDVKLAFEQEQNKEKIKQEELPKKNKTENLSPEEVEKYWKDK